MLINYENHCSFNVEIRNLYYLKRSINNSKEYSEKEKMKLTNSIEHKIITEWNRIKILIKEGEIINND